MEISAPDAVKEELIKENQTFRELAQQHHEYEERLTELAELTYPNDEELLEESTLKKKKLSVKDEMYSMLQDYSSQQV